MPRVLLVTSSYAPAVIADMHRVRQLAWDLPHVGWDVEVLAPNIEFQGRQYLDQESGPLFNPDVVCHEVAPHWSALFRVLNMRSIGWRAFRPLCEAGAALLEGHRFDLVYISTAHFPLFCLGPRWKRLFGVPYILDYQDPWVRPTGKYKTTRHALKRGVVTTVSPWLERYALKDAAGLVSVSPAYLNELRKRHGNVRCLEPGRCQVIPFAAADPIYKISDELTTRCLTDREIVYVGAGGSLMAKSFETICKALSQARDRERNLLTPIKIRAYGTLGQWAGGGAKPFEDIARRFDLSDVVEEWPSRISYTKATELAGRSDGLLILGADDAGYTPSKLFSYALTGKPLLACLRADSPPTAMFQETAGLGNLITFSDCQGRETDIAGTMRAFLGEVAGRARFDRRILLADHLSPAMAVKHARLFARILGEVTAA